MKGIWREPINISMKRIVFITGGAKSGKSSFALKLADEWALKEKYPSISKAYIATAQALDEEMRDRIERHKKSRSEEWITFEEPIYIDNLIKDLGNKHSIILVDCLTLWLSNLLLNNKNGEAEIESFISTLSTIDCFLLTVSNEVGMCIVPDNRLARIFRDLAGYMNQRIAEIADEAYLVVSGIPIKLK